MKMSRRFLNLCLLPSGLFAMMIAGCGSSPSIQGNWYVTDPNYTPTAASPISGVGLALMQQGQSLTGNVTTYLVSNGLACNSLGFLLPATGTIDGSNHVNLTASDGIIQFQFAGVLNGSRTAFTNATYTVMGEEAYPQGAGGIIGHLQKNATAPPSCSGTLKGSLVP